MALHNLVSILTALLLAATVPACGSEESATDTGADAGSTTDSSATTDAIAGGDALPGLAPAKTLFDPLGVHEVQITLAPADWQDILATAADVSLVRNYHTAEVLYDGVAYHKVGTRVFGESSMWNYPEKPNIRLKFDEIDNALKGPDDMDSIRLKAGGSEPTFLRELITLDLLRSVAKAAPRFSFARVTVNGKFMGFYQLSEQPDSHLFKRAFGDGKGNVYEPLMVCFGLNCPPEGCDTLKSKYTLKQGDFAEITALATTIQNATDAEFAAKVDAQADLADLLAVYAVEDVASEMDGLAASGTNFQFYVDPKDKRVHVVRAGVDETLGPNTLTLLHPWGPPNVLCKTRDEHFFNRMLAIPALKTQYLAIQKKLLCGAFAEAPLLKWIEERRPLLRAELERDPFVTVKGADYDSEVDSLENWIDQRTLALQKLVGSTCP